MNKNKNSPPASLATDMKAIWAQHRERRQEARLNADPRAHRRRQAVRIAAGAIGVAAAVYAFRRGAPLNLSGLAKPEATGQGKLRDRLTPLAKSVTRDILGPERLHTGRRLQMARSGARDPENARRHRGLTATGMVLAAAGILQPVHSEAPAPVPTDRASVEHAIGENIFMRPADPVAVKEVAPTTPIYRTAKPGDGPYRWASELVEANVSAGQLSAPEVENNVADIANIIIDTNPAIAGDKNHWMNLGDAYDITQATAAAHRLHDHR